ncbi:hypothetical protein HPB50_004602 [Hyalomma asiaticum]|uniref:Uncharacterized protein n=1 Tax=Hyalomma asiaticum TaxID=266040 RepID=A0ACB7TCI7_HYAAI|nr:hypothetical protein HPB50_004602 [Hyalomma asiaticum]
MGPETRRQYVSAGCTRQGVGRLLFVPCAPAGFQECYFQRRSNAVYRSSLLYCLIALENVKQEVVTQQSWLAKLRARRVDVGTSHSFFLPL